MNERAPLDAPDGIAVGMPNERPVMPFNNPTVW